MVIDFSFIQLIGCKVFKRIEYLVWEENIIWFIFQLGFVIFLEKNKLDFIGVFSLENNKGKIGIIIC